MSSPLATPVGPGGSIARFTGKIFVALGFILGTYGLTEGQPAVMQAGLALLVTGVLASGYGLYRWVRESRDQERTPK